MLSFLKRYWKSILVFVFIFYVSIIRIAPVKEVSSIPYFDKYVHFLMYLGFSFFLYLDYIRNRTIRPLLIALIVILIPSALGGIIEILQGAYFPPRTAEWSDFFSDAAGALVAFNALNLYFLKKARSSN
jgi:VanZ family protein